jgi:hypothetical protein
MTLTQPKDIKIIPGTSNTEGPSRGDAGERKPQEARIIYDPDDGGKYATALETKLLKVSKRLAELEQRIDALELKILNPNSEAKENVETKIIPNAKPQMNSTKLENGRNSYLKKVVDSIMRQHSR